MEKERLEYNPFTKIWSKPRAVIAELLVKTNIWSIFLVSILGAWGFSFLDELDKAGQKEVSSGIFFSNEHIGITLVSTFVTSALSLLIGSAIIAFFYWIIGKMFGGKGTYYDLYKGSMLTSFSGILVLPVFLIWLFTSSTTFYNTDMLSGSGYTWLILTSILSTVAGIYSFIFGIVMISEVHQFSKWRAFFTMILPIMFFVVIILLIVTLFFAAMFTS